jgi:hypothetical protein
MWATKFFTHVKQFARLYFIFLKLDKVCEFEKKKKAGVTKKQLSVKFYFIYFLAQKPHLGQGRLILWGL